jgi:hypothetical protein
MKVDGINELEISLAVQSRQGHGGGLVVDEVALGQFFFKYFQ